MTLDEIGLRYGTDKASSGHKYLAHYERVLTPLRDDAFTMIEIGGLNGASLQMWRDFFPSATIVCVDIKPDVKRFEEERVGVEDRGLRLARVPGRPRREIPVAACGARRRLTPVGSPAHRVSAAVPGARGRRHLHRRGSAHELQAGIRRHGRHPVRRLLKVAVDHLNLRGDRAKDFRKRQSRAFGRCVTQIDSLLFIRRACIIQKRG